MLMYVVLLYIVKVETPALSIMIPEVTILGTLYAKGKIPKKKKVRYEIYFELAN